MAKVDKNKKLRTWKVAADCLVDDCLVEWEVEAVTEEDAWMKGYELAMKSNVADSGSVDVLYEITKKLSGRILTDHELQKIEFANTKVKGTSDYGKFYMCNETNEVHPGRWSWIGWNIPTMKNGQVAVLKQVKDKLYIMQGHQRWTVRDSVLELLNLYSKNGGEQV